MGPQIAVSWLGIGCAVIAAFIFGFLWYGPIFGRTWGTLMGMDMSKKPESKMMMKSMLIQLLGIFLTTYVLTFSTKVWLPSAWGQAGIDGPMYMYALYSAFFTWIGFYIPLQLNKVAWEGRPWKLFFINAGHDIINLLIVTMILVHL